MQSHNRHVISVVPQQMVQWTVSKMVTVLGSHLSKTASFFGPNGTKALQSTFVGQPPLYEGQLELAHRWLS